MLEKELERETAMRGLGVARPPPARPPRPLLQLQLLPPTSHGSPHPQTREVGVDVLKGTIAAW